MKKSILLFCCCIMQIFISAQSQLPPPLPKQEIAKPQPNIKLLQLSNVIVGKWKGARLSNALNGTITVDSLWLEFKKDGTLNFKHQKYEFNGPVTGTYTINKNTIRIVADKFPFKHTLEGSWNVNNGLINGTFREVRERDNTQPSYYIPGTDSGTYNLIKQ